MPDMSSSSEKVKELHAPEMIYKNLILETGICRAVKAHSNSLPD